VNLFMKAIQIQACDKVKLRIFSDHVVELQQSAVSGLLAILKAVPHAEEVRAFLSRLVGPWPFFIIFCGARPPDRAC